MTEEELKLKEANLEKDEKQREGVAKRDSVHKSKRRRSSTASSLSSLQSKEAVKDVDSQVEMVDSLKYLPTISPSIRCIGVCWVVESFASMLANQNKWALSIILLHGYSQRTAYL